MRFEVDHTTRYRFSAPVFLEQHQFRFRPRSNSWQQLTRFSLEVDPAPAGAAENLDIEGNDVTSAWFFDLTDHLTMTARFEVETLRTNPFDFLPSDPHTIPMRYPAELTPLLAPYTTHESSEPLRQYAEAVANGAAHDAPSFAAHLARRLHEDCRQVLRLEGDPWAPEYTLSRGEGACRDLAVLYAALCREVGLAARFVSGYCPADETEPNELHAWAEVYLPGGGWRGFDPSLGLAVADGHIAVASAPAAELAAPVSGSFRGEAVAAPIETTLTIRRLG